MISLIYFILRSLDIRREWLIGPNVDFNKYMNKKLCFMVVPTASCPLSLVSADLWAGQYTGNIL